MATTEDLPKAWRPPMGWNSWDSYGTTVAEREVLANARFMAEHLKDAGWDTLVIDAGWFDPNAHAHGYSDGTPLCIDAYGRQIPDERRFPERGRRSTDGETVPDRRRIATNRTYRNTIQPNKQPTPSKDTP